MYHEEYKAFCPECDENKYRLKEAAHFMEEIVKQLYMKEPLDMEKLDDCISEICHYLNVKLGIESLQIVRKKEISYISDWMQDSNQFLKSLITKES